MKGLGEKERYTHLIAEFQRIARRENKAFLNDQCKETEENSRMGKTRDLFRKIEKPRKHFMQRWAQKGQKRHGPNRSRRDKEEVARRTVQKVLNDPNDHDGVVTHLEPGE